jgi:hypothetical protein
MTLRNFGRKVCAPNPSSSPHVLCAPSPPQPSQALSNTLPVSHPSH